MGRPDNTGAPAGPMGAVPRAKRGMAASRSVRNVPTSYGYAFAAREIRAFTHAWPLKLAS